VRDTVEADRPDVEVQVWLQDELRAGQQGTLTNVWAERGSRPRAVKQTEYDWVYLFAATCPTTGASSALLAPTVNTDYMNRHLAFIGKEACEQAGHDVHVVLVLDGAGWHHSKDLVVPENITLLPLPPYSPELNGHEIVFGYLRQQYLANRVFRDYDHLFEEVRAAWLSLTPERLMSLTHTEWIGRAFAS
jgi:transposase